MRTPAALPIGVSTAAAICTEPLVGLAEPHDELGRDGLSDEVHAFIAGVLKALPALRAVGAPIVASHRKLIP